MQIFNILDDINGQVYEKIVEWVRTKCNITHELHININSVGGNVDAAIAIYKFLKGLHCNVHTTNLYEVSSAAVLVYLAGSERDFKDHARLLIHPIRVFFDYGVNVYTLKEKQTIMKNQIENYADIVTNETKYSIPKEKLIKALSGGNSLVISDDEAIRCGLATSRISDDCDVCLIPNGPPMY